MTKRYTKQIGLFITMFIYFYANGQTKDIETTAEIKHLIIYNSSAEINYQKEMVLPEGKTTITFTDLSPFIVRNTINVSVSDPSVDIITITDKINYIKERTDQHKKTDHLQDSINHLANELGLLKCRTEAMRMDQVPVLSYNERIKFSVPDSELADYNKQEGTLIWNFPLQQHENKAFDYRYEIRSPRGTGNPQRPAKRKFRTISCPMF